MPAIAGTLVTTNIVGTREDLSEIISNIDPTETIFLSNAGKRPKADNTFVEWQLDHLLAPNLANAQPEGNDATFSAPNPTVRVGAHMQISNATLIVSGSAEATKKAGRKSETGFQLAKEAKQLKRDIESICIARNTGDTGTDPRRSPTLLSYIRTNTVFGAAGANPAAPAPTYAGNRTDGTLAPFTQAQLDSVISTAYITGMKIAGAVLMLSPLHKQKFNTFTNRATPMLAVTQKPAAILSAFDVYVSDFGNISTTTNRFQRDRDSFLLDFDLIGIKDLRPYEVIDLAKSGDANKKLLQREWTLQVDNEAGQAGIFDLNDA